MGEMDSNVHISRKPPTVRRLGKLSLEYQAQIEYVDQIAPIGHAQCYDEKHMNYVHVQLCSRAPGTMSSPHQVYSMCRVS